MIVNRIQGSIEIDRAKNLPTRGNFDRILTALVKNLPVNKITMQIHDPEPQSNLRADRPQRLNLFESIAPPRPEPAPFQTRTQTQVESHEPLINMDGQITRLDRSEDRPQIPKKTERSSPQAVAGAEVARTERTAPRSKPSDIRSLINRTAEKHGLSSDLLMAVATAESSLNPNAVSPMGAMGLMQLMPGTAEELGVSDPFDPAQNLDGGCRYLKGLLRRYQGDTRKALAAYNWGIGRIDRHGLGKLPSETRTFINRVLNIQAKLNNTARA